MPPAYPHDGGATGACPTPDTLGISDCDQVQASGLQPEAIRA